MRSVAVATLLLGAAPMNAIPCIHAPLGYTGKPVSEQEKVVFLFHDGRNANLVLKTSLHSESGLPSAMAWVIPVPALPSRYEEVSERLFPEIKEVISRSSEQAKAKQGLAKPASLAKAEAQIRIHPTQVIGRYRVQPVEILAESAGAELNAWLTSNGFSTVPPANQKFYLKKGAAFVALRIEGLKGAANELKPLRIVYPDDRLRLPLKFSTHSGVFDVTLYTLTAAEPRPDALESFGFSMSAQAAFDNATAAKAPELAKLVEAKRGFISEFKAQKFNHRCMPVAELGEDPSIMPDGRSPDRPAEAKRAKASRDCFNAETAGSGAARLALARALEQSDMPAAVKAYVSLARAGNGDAALRLYEIYESGAPGVARDLAESRKWYNAARVLGADVPPRK